MPTGVHRRVRVVWGPVSSSILRAFGKYMAGARNGQMNIFSPWRGSSLLLVLSIATLVSANGLPRGVDPAAALL